MPATLEDNLETLGRPIDEALQEVGITPKVLAEKLKEELDAEETRHFAYQGQVVDKKDVIAWHIRQRARQDAHKLRGDYPAEKHEHHGKITVEVVDFAEATEEKPET